MTTFARPTEALVPALRPALDGLRARRAWIRYHIRLRVKEFYEQTPLRSPGIVYPDPIYVRLKPGDAPSTAWPRNEIEASPWHAPFPGGHHDELMATVRWRHRGWRTTSPRSPRVSKPRDGAPAAVPGSKYPVWLDDWTSSLPPGRHMLSSWGITEDDAQKDYHHRFRVITRLDAMHQSLLTTARDLLRGAAAFERSFAEESTAIFLPAPPDWLLHAPGQTPALP